MKMAHAVVVEPPIKNSNSHSFSILTEIVANARINEVKKIQALFLSVVAVFVFGLVLTRAVFAIAPSVVINSPLPNSVVAGDVNFSATASMSTQSGNVAATVLYIDNIVVASSAGNTAFYLWPTTLVANGSHNLMALSWNSNNEVGYMTESVMVNNPDATPPSVMISSPNDGTTVATGKITVISANATDTGLVSSGISKVEFYVNSVLVCTDLSPNFSCDWKVPNKKHVSYSLSAKAYDNSSNVGVSPTVMVTSR